MSTHRRLPLGRIAAIAFVIALLLPFPGPHIDSYLPVAAVAFHPDARDADRGFFVLLAIILGIYFAVAFGIVTLVAYLTRAFRRGTT